MVEGLSQILSNILRRLNSIKLQQPHIANISDICGETENFVVKCP